MCMHTWRILRYTKSDSEPVQSKWLAKGNLERNATHKWFKLPWVCNSLSESTHVSIPTYHTLHLLLNTLFHYFPSCGSSFLQTEDLGSYRSPLVYWLGFGPSPLWLGPQSLAWNWRPASSCCRPRLQATKDWGLSKDQILSYPCCHGILDSNLE